MISKHYQQVVGSHDLMKKKKRKHETEKIKEPKGKIQEGKSSSKISTRVFAGKRLVDEDRSGNCRVLMEAPVARC